MKQKILAKIVELRGNLFERCEQFPDVTFVSTRIGDKLSLRDVNMLGRPIIVVVNSVPKAGDPDIRLLKVGTRLERVKVLEKNWENPEMPEVLLRVLDEPAPDIVEEYTFTEEEWTD